MNGATHMISLTTALRILDCGKTAHEQLDQQAANALNGMALDRLGLETLETRNSDGLDFHDVSVWQVRDLIARAYAMGVRDAVTVGTD